MFNVFKTKSGLCAIEVNKGDENYLALSAFYSKNALSSITVDTLDLDQIHNMDIVNGQLIISDSLLNQCKRNIEVEWQTSTLQKVSASILQYQTDMAIDELYSELRAQTYNEDDYFALLGDRKLLIEYVQQEDFPECGRPALSGLITV